MIHNTYSYHVILMMSVHQAMFMSKLNSSLYEMSTTEGYRYTSLLIAQYHNYVIFLNSMFTQL